MKKLVIVFSFLVLIACLFASAVNAVYKDETLQCKECGSEFIFTAGEQEFYADRGLSIKPSRCKNCSDAKKQIPSRLNNYVIDCAECGKETSVPFEPKEGRPVYCSECHRKLLNS